MLKPRCNKCYTTLRRREISISEYLRLPIQLCSDCLTNYIEDQFRKVDECI